MKPNDPSLEPLASNPTSGSAIPSNPMQLWMLHFVFVAAIPVYAAVAWLVILPRLPLAPPLPVPQLLLFIALLVVAVVNVIIGYNWERFVTAHALAGEHPSDIYLDKVRTLVLLSDSLFESIAVFGLVGLMFGLTPIEGFGFMALSFIMLMINTNRLATWIEEYRRRVRQEKIVDEK